jgi:hypothetical protein
MTDSPDKNPLLRPIRDSFQVKRSHRTGLIPRNWLLILLRILDLLRDRAQPLDEDEIYTYDFTLKHSRAAAIPALLGKYGMPIHIGLSKEGVTVRGAPGYRVFRAIGGGTAIMNRKPAEREALILEAVELIREELLKIVGQKPVSLPESVFQHTAKFVPALLEAVANRSNGRVEQAIVGAKLQLRFPDTDVPLNAGYAPDRQTGREADFEVGQIRVLVSVTPSPEHFKSAESLADEGRQVFLVVSKKAFPAAQRRIKNDGYEGIVTVADVSSYVTNNMKEVGHDLHIDAHEACMKLVAEYNRRIASDLDHSLQVVLPS